MTNISCLPSTIDLKQCARKTETYKTIFEHEQFFTTINQLLWEHDLYFCNSLESPSTAIFFCLIIALIEKPTTQLRLEQVTAGIARKSHDTDCLTIYYYTAHATIVNNLLSDPTVDLQHVNIYLLFGH